MNDDQGLRKAAENAAMYLRTGFIECDRCGHEVPTADTDAEYELNATLTQPSGKVSAGWFATIADALESYVRELPPSHYSHRYTKPAVAALREADQIPAHPVSGERMEEAQPAQLDLERFRTGGKYNKNMVADSTGEWVRLTDAQAHIATLTADRDAWKRQEAENAEAAVEQIDALTAKVEEFRRAETVEARVAQLEEALEPFASVGCEMLGQTKPDEWDAWGYNNSVLTYGDFRRARAALGGQSNG